MRQRMQPERARRNCPNSELPSSNLDQFFVSPLGGAKKRLGASDLTRGLHGHSCLRVRVGTLELPKRDKSIAKLQIRAPSKWQLRRRLMPVADLLKENAKGDKPFHSSSSARFALRKLNNLDPRIIR